VLDLDDLDELHQARGHVLDLDNVVHDVQLLLQVAHLEVGHLDLLVAQQIGHLLEEHQKVLEAVLRVVADQQVHAVDQQLVRDHLAHEEFADELDVGHDLVAPPQLFLEGTVQALAPLVLFVEDLLALVQHGTLEHVFLLEDCVELVVERQSELSDEGDVLGLVGGPFEELLTQLEHQVVVLLELEDVLQRVLLVVSGELVEGQPNFFDLAVRLGHLAHRFLAGSERGEDLALLLELGGGLAFLFLLHLAEHALDVVEHAYVHFLLVQAAQFALVLRTHLLVRALLDGQGFQVLSGQPHASVVALLLLVLGHAPVDVLVPDAHGVHVQRQLAVERGLGQHLLEGVTAHNVLLEHLGVAFEFLHAVLLLRLLLPLLEEIRVSFLVLLDALVALALGSLELLLVLWPLLDVLVALGVPVVAEHGHLLGVVVVLVLALWLLLFLDLLLLGDPVDVVGFVEGWELHVLDLVELGLLLYLVHNLLAVGVVGGVVLVVFLVLLDLLVHYVVLQAELLCVLLGHARGDLVEPDLVRVLHQDLLVGAMFELLQVLVAVRVHRFSFLAGAFIRGLHSSSSAAATARRASSPTARPPAPFSFVLVIFVFS